jgi:hypothetical protein
MRPTSSGIPSWQGPGIYAVQGINEEEEQIALSRTVILPESISVLDLREEAPERHE